MISTEAVVPVNNNQVSLNAGPIINATLVGTALTVTTKFPHNLIPGNSVTTANIQGFVTNPNGTFVVVTVVTAFQFTITVVATLGAYTAGSGHITSSTMLSDYYHLFAVKAKFLEPFPAVTITSALNITPIVIVVSGTQNLRTGEQVVISGVLGNTAANGTHYLKRYNYNKFALYSDKDLVTAVAGNGQYTSGGTISRISYEYCKNYISDKKIDSYSTPAVLVPGYAVANKLLKLYPQDKTCSEVTVDYMTTPPALIDPSDNVLDLEDYYSYNTLLYINDRAAKLFAGRSRDEDLYLTSEEELKTDR